MSIRCNVILEENATPEQLSALGAGLWRWCVRAAGHTGMYQYLNNQTLADLIAGQFPAPEGERNVHFRVRDYVSHDRQTTIDSLRREIPAQGVEDILVDGKSWHRTDLPTTSRPVSGAF